MGQGRLKQLVMGVVAVCAVGIANGEPPEIPPVVIPVLQASARTPEAFVPRGWRIETRLVGAVDADQRPDAVLVLKATDPRNVLSNDGPGMPSIDSNPRLIVVLQNDPKVGYRLLAQDATLVPRHESPTLSDVFEDSGGVVLDKRVLRVTLYHFANMGSWSTGTTTHTFRWQDGCMRLIGYDSRSTHRGSGETEHLSINLLSRRSILTTGSVSGDESDVSTVSKLPGRGVVCLQDVGDSFDPQGP